MISRFIIPMAGFVLCTAYFLYIPLDVRVVDSWLWRTAIFLLNSARFGAKIGGFFTGTSYMQIISSANQLFRVSESKDSTLEVLWVNFSNVPVLLTKPVSRREDGLTGALLLFHGGGFAFMSASIYQPLSRYLALELQVPVFAVDYRKAPKYLYPAAHDDALASVEFLLANAHDFGVDPQRVVLMGESAGGTLSAFVSHELRHRSHRPAAQILLYPWLQSFDFRTPSFQSNEANSGNSVLSAELLADFWLSYVGQPLSLASQLLINNHTSPAMKRSKTGQLLRHSQIPSKYIHEGYVRNDMSVGSEQLAARLERWVLDPRLAPLLEPDLSDLPPTLVLTVEFDVLRDDGLIYVERLRAAGVQVEHEHFDGTGHGCVNYGIAGFYLTSPPALRFTARAIEYAKRVFS